MTYFALAAQLRKFTCCTNNVEYVECLSSINFHPPHTYLGIQDERIIELRLPLFNTFSSEIASLWLDTAWKHLQKSFGPVKCDLSFLNCDFILSSSFHCHLEFCHFVMTFNKNLGLPNFYMILLLLTSEQMKPEFCGSLLHIWMLWQRVVPCFKWDFHILILWVGGGGFLQFMPLW